MVDMSAGCYITHTIILHVSVGHTHCNTMHTVHTHTRLCNQKYVEVKSCYYWRIRSRSRSQEQKSVKSLTPPLHFVTDMAQSRCKCSDGKSISVVHGMTLCACSHTGRRACADFKFSISKQA